MNINEIAAYITALRKEEHYPIARAVRRATGMLDVVPVDIIVKAAVLAGINKHTARIQANAQRKNDLRIARTLDGLKDEKKILDYMQANMKWISI